MWHAAGDKVHIHVYKKTSSVLTVEPLDGRAGSLVVLVSNGSFAFRKPGSFISVYPDLRPSRLLVVLLSIQHILFR